MDTADYTMHVLLVPVGVLVTIDDPLPNRLRLEQNHPNPFNAYTTIEYHIPVRTHVTLDIFNVLGQHIQTIADAEHSAGTHIRSWDGRSASGETVSSGIYLFRLRTGDMVVTRKMMLVK